MTIVSPIQRQPKLTIFDSLQQNNIFNRPKSRFWVRLGFGDGFDRGGSQNGAQNSGVVVYKTVTKTPVELKIMKNLDFGLLEMLFCCRVSNMVSFGCLWIGETIVTKISNTFYWSHFWEHPQWPHWIWTQNDGFSLNFGLNCMNFIKISPTSESVTSRLLARLQFFWYLLCLTRAEKLKNGIYVARGYDLPPLPRANVKRNFEREKIQVDPPDDVHHPTMWKISNRVCKETLWDSVVNGCGFLLSKIVFFHVFQFFFQSDIALTPKQKVWKIIQKENRI